MAGTVTTSPAAERAASWSTMGGALQGEEGREEHDQHHDHPADQDLPGRHPPSSCRIRSRATIEPRVSAMVSSVETAAERMPTIRSRLTGERHHARAEQRRRRARRRFELGGDEQRRKAPEHRDQREDEAEPQHPEDHPPQRAQVFGDKQALADLGIGEGKKNHGIDRAGTCEAPKARSRHVEQGPRSSTIRAGKDARPRSPPRRSPRKKGRDHHHPPPCTASVRRQSAGPPPSVQAMASAAPTAMAWNRLTAPPARQSQQAMPGHFLVGNRAPETAGSAPPSAFATARLP